MQWLRLAMIPFLSLLAIEMWYSIGHDNPMLFAVIVGGIPILVLTVAIPAGWLSKESLRKSWGWLFGIEDAENEESRSESEATERRLRRR